MTWAGFGTFAAACTLFLVDVCEEAVYVDSIEFTYLFALVATYTSHLAYRHYVFAFVVVVATYSVAKVVWYEFD